MNEIMVNHYLYIREDGTWNWSDGVFSGIATLETDDNVSEYCLERAENMRYSEYGNYDHLSKNEREALAQRWEAAINMPVGEYDYYFNLENKYEVFKKSVKELAKKLGIDYELTIKDRKGKND